MMEILMSLAFIACCGVYLYVANKFMSRIMTSIRNKRLNLLITSIIGLFIMLLFFVEYWLLTGQLPLKSILFLLSSSILAMLIYEISGAALGITLDETKNKIQVLSIVSGFEFGLKYPRISVVNGILGLLMFAGWITALIIYWSTSTMTPQALFWISICIFIIPQVVGMIIVNQFTVPSLLSDEYDNDLRNHYFINGFGNVLTTTIFLMLPLSLFYSYHEASSLPPYWLLLLTPILLFVVLTILPFMIGTNKFYYKQLYNINWRIDWLAAVNRAIAMPDANIRQGILEEKIAEMDKAINEHKSEHEVLKYVDDSDTSYLQNLASGNDKLRTIIDIFRTNRENIHKWDFRANHLKNLHELANNLDVEHSENSRAFIALSLGNAEKERENLSKTKSKMAGAIITMATALIGFVFKHYQDDILRILGQLS